MDKGELTFIFDVDGTLCPIKRKDQEYEDLAPYPGMVEKLREYKARGARIVLFTSRNMRTYAGDLGKINKYTAPVMMAWLEKWEIPYDEIIFGKPWPGHVGYYVDDRSVRPAEFLTHTPEQLKEICDRDRQGMEEDDGK